MTNNGGMQGKLDTSEQKKSKNKTHPREDEKFKVTSVPQNNREERPKSSDESPEAIREKRVENITKQV